VIIDLYHSSDCAIADHKTNMVCKLFNIISMESEFFQRYEHARSTTTLQNCTFSVCLGMTISTCYWVNYS